VLRVIRHAESARQLPITPPADFPHQQHSNVLALVSAACAGQSERAAAGNEFAAAWSGVLYRFCAFDAHFVSLSRALAQVHAATPQAMYELERDLFGVFTNGVATLESIAYGVFALGALVRPETFPLETPTDRRNATVGSALRLYSERFHDEDVTRVLFWWYNSREYGWWKDTRNLLAQQTVTMAPGDNCMLGGVRMSAEELVRKRSWLVHVVSELLVAVDAFAAQRLTHTGSVGA
jgi:hypothetical protein